jgi:hypothetical protein
MQDALEHSKNQTFEKGPNVAEMDKLLDEHDETIAEEVARCK